MSRLILQVPATIVMERHSGVPRRPCFSRAFALPRGWGWGEPPRKCRAGEQAMRQGLRPKELQSRGATTFPGRVRARPSRNP